MLSFSITAYLLYIYLHINSHITLLYVTVQTTEVTHLPIAVRRVRKLLYPFTFTLLTLPYDYGENWSLAFKI